MLNEVITGIAQKLNQVFGDGYEIYIDNVEQGLKEPCFLIVCLQGTQSQIVGNLYLRELAFDIHYFPKSKTESTYEINEGVNSLLMGLEYITAGSDLTRGTKIRHEIVDGVLHFFVNYDVRIRKEVIPDEYMGTLTTKERVRINGG